MTRRKIEATDPTGRHWGDTSRAGTKVRIRGERGEFTVLHEAGPDDPGGEHVALFGGSHTQFRHVRPDAVVWPRRKRSS